MFGFTINTEVLKKDAPSLSSAFGMLEFLRQVIDRLDDSGVKGIFLVLDEIDAIADNPDFAHLVKGLVDTNALAKDPIPLLLMLCGVEECRRKMIKNHEPIDRIFDVIEIEPMSTVEMEVFFIRAFESVGMTVQSEAMGVLTHYSAGFPKIMHLLGDAAYWHDKDNTLNRDDALAAAVVAADEVGKKYVDQQVYKALRSDDYRSILKKITKVSPADMSFKRSDVAAGLTEGEKKKLDNFLRRMKALKVIRSGDTPGEYVFNVRMVRLYIWMQSR